VIVRLKWGQTEYKGRLESIDSYMNVLLRDTEEFIDGKPTGTLGLVLIRCVDNIPKSALAMSLSLGLRGLLFVVCGRVGATPADENRCNNILWMGSAENVEMTDLGLR
jgi:small nuclear ribonucleoprotein F